MVLTIVAGVAGAVYAAVACYRRAKSVDPAATKVAVDGFVQVIGVFAAIVNGVKAILDALGGTYAPAYAGGVSQRQYQHRIGRPAGEVEGGDD